MDMETTVLTGILIICLYIFLQIFRTARRNRLPPFPGVPIPIIGHLHLLKPPLHRTLYRLSQNHGPIFSLRLGSRLVVVVSSPSLAEECFTTHDAVLANRPRNLAGKYIGYNNGTMAGLPYSDQWRHLRRLSAQEIFSAARINSFLPIPQDEVKHLLQSLYRDSKTSFAKVELKPKLGQAAFNVIMRMIAGKRYFGENNSQETKNNVPELINEVMETAEASNPEDFFPLLRWLDFRGLKKKLARLGDRMDAFQQSLIDEHRREKRSSTMIGHLLSLQESQPLYYTDLTIKGLINNMIVAGTDTSAVTMEWAMSALLNHPEVMKKARAELDRVVGCGRLVDEPDLSELPYLQCIISETFRLFPAGPMLLPHYSSQPCKVGGYEIPSDTMLLVNAWAIHRDPGLWDDPMRFVPERFEGKEGESSHLLMPFGMGRRSCPGAGLARRMIGLVLASLIQCFDWERVTKDQVDMTEGKGLTMPKAKPLEAMCKAREEMHKVLALP
nr:cytochrome P450 81E8-like [Ipomoea batatas]